MKCNYNDFRKKHALHVSITFLISADSGYMVSARDYGEKKNNRSTCTESINGEYSSTSAPVLERHHALRKLQIVN
jgi:hypothetical protein